MNYQELHWVSKRVMTFEDRILGVAEKEPLKKTGISRFFLLAGKGFMWEKGDWHAMVSAVQNLLLTNLVVCCLSLQ